MISTFLRTTVALAAFTATPLVISAAPPAAGALAPTVTASLDSSTYRAGDKPVLTLSENVTGRRSFSVTDSSGAVWTRTSDSTTGASFTTTTTSKDATVTVSMTRSSDGATSTTRVSYRIEQWPGHVPGQLALGRTCGSPCAQRETALDHPYGVRRQFEQWGDWTGVAADIDLNHAANRLPWVSVKGPGSNAAGWRAVAAGTYDNDIRALATTLKAHDDNPIILTFHHEPSNDATEAEGKDWAAAFSRIHDVLHAESALANVAYAPIIGDWLFNTKNAVGDPKNWVTPAVLSRSSFFGVDLYEQTNGESFAQRLPRILTYLASLGYPELQVGIGEFASTDAAYPAKSAVQWLNESLGWATANTDKIGVAACYDAAVNSRDGVYWPLDESAAKIAAFRSWLDNPRVD